MPEVKKENQEKEQLTFECPKCHGIFPKNFAVKFSIQKDSKNEFVLGCKNCVRGYIHKAAELSPTLPSDIDVMRAILYFDKRRKENYINE